MLAHPVSSASGSGPDELLAQAISPLTSLQVHHEVDGLGDDGPHHLGEPAVTGDQHVMPDARGDVGAEVAVAVGVFDDAVA